MKNKQTYEQIASQEFVNHSIESALSAITSTVFYFAGYGFDYARSFVPQQKVQTALSTISWGSKFIGTRFAKDTVIEFFAAIGHFPGFNMLAEKSTYYFGYEKNERSIGSQETYSQIVEGTNKILPLAAFEVFVKPHISSNIFELDQISFWSEIGTSCFRVAGYYFYDLASPHANYTTGDHFGREYELHTKTEGFILVPLGIVAGSAKKFLGHSNFFTNTIIEEATIEFIKGLSFKVVQTNCPSCSEYKNDFSDYVEALLVGDEACHTQEPHIEL